MFGTDIFGGERVENALAKARLVREFLETEQGLNLPRHFCRIVGPRPRELQIDLAIEECDRLSGEEASLSLKPLKETVAGIVAERMRRLAQSF